MSITESVPSVKATPAKQKASKMFFREMFANTKGTKLVLEPGYRKTRFASVDIDEVADAGVNAPDLGFKIATFDWNKLEPRLEKEHGFATGDKSEILELVAITADVDADKPDYPSRDQVLLALAGMPCKPSYVVNSNGERGGFHVYWFFVVPVSCDEYDRVAELSKRWQELLKRYIETVATGVAKPLDQTHSPNRPLRCPGSKRAKSGQYVEVLTRNLGADGEVARYSLDELESQVDRLLPEKSEPSRREYVPNQSDEDKPISTYLASHRIDLEAILEGQGWKRLGEKKWIHPKSESGAHSAVDYENGGCKGITVRSGNCGLEQGKWYSTEALWVAFNHGDDSDGWRKAAAFCHAEMELEREAVEDKVDLSGIENAHEKSETSKIPGKTEVVRALSRIEYQEFPVDRLPATMRDFVVEGARAIGCDSSLIALPTLALIGGAVGNARKLEVKPGWYEPCILWTACIGESGTSKTPAFNYAKAPFQRVENKWMRDNELTNAQFATDKAIYERDLADWKKKKTTDLPPSPPEQPQQRRNFFSDCTVESLIPLLKDNPRGLVGVFDELSAWFGSFDKYSKGKGSDASHWLSMFNGSSITVDRKTGIPKTLFVPEAAVSITGGIQPKILTEMLGEKHIENGLAARFLMAYPPRVPKKWREQSADQATVDRMNQVAEYLSELPLCNADFSGSVSLCLKQTSSAKSLFVAFYDEHNREQNELKGPLCNAWSKMECYVPRIALAFHLVRYASGDKTLESSDLVDAKSMADAISVVEWFKNETKRIHQEIGMTETQREETAVYSALEQLCIKVTARDLYPKVRRQVENLEHLEQILGRLLLFGQIEKADVNPKPTGGRPTWVYGIKKC